MVNRLKQESFSRYLQVLGEIPQGSRLLDCSAATSFLAELVRARGLDAYAIELSSFEVEACHQLLGADRVYEARRKMHGAQRIW